MSEPDCQPYWIACPNCVQYHKSGGCSIGKKMRDGEYSSLLNRLLDLKFVILNVHIAECSLYKRRLSLEELKVKRASMKEMGIDIDLEMLRYLEEEGKL